MVPTCTGRSRYRAGEICLLDLLLRCTILAAAARTPSSSHQLDRMKNLSLAENDTGGQAVTLRLFLVRHGETEANAQDFVVGQEDSPLTEKGRNQAVALGQSSELQSDFWKIFCSDLGRAKETARLVLQDRRSDIVFDERIRELSKGARQGYPKDWSYEQALSRRHKDQAPIPLLETEDDAWFRLSQWLDYVIASVVADAQAKVDDDDNDGDSCIARDKTIYPVLAIGHSGSYRIFLERLVGQEQLRAHPDAQYDPLGRFYIPNTSLTILDVTLVVPSRRPESGVVDSSRSAIQKVDVVLLTSTKHYERVDSTAPTASQR